MCELCDMGGGGVFDYCEAVARNAEGPYLLRYINSLRSILETEPEELDHEKITEAIFSLAHARTNIPSGHPDGSWIISYSMTTTLMLDSLGKKISQGGSLGIKNGFQALLVHLYNAFDCRPAPG